MIRFGLALALYAFCLADLQAREPWVTLKDCRYVPNDANDGDSFRVRSGKKTYIFRLYFVDAPETDLEFKERADEQARYFGVTAPQTIQVGEVAKNFVREKLSRPFVVRTCMQDALGRSKKERFYAFVEVDRRDLGEELVANGLARLHGTDTQPPGMISAEVEWQKLEQLQQTAKQQKIGAWGVNAGRLNTRVQTKQQNAADSFDAFFHPERLRVPSTPVPAVRALPSPSLRVAAAATTNISPGPPTAASPERKQLDANTATDQELQALPGIGKVLSQRIIAARPFKNADDLRRVRGIGPKKYEKLRPYFD